MYYEYVCIYIIIYLFWRSPTIVLKKNKKDAEFRDQIGWAEQRKLYLQALQ